MARMAGSGSSGGPPAPRAGTGPTIIAGALVVLVIGLGWLNHGGGTVDEGSTPFARDVTRAVEDARQDGAIPASQPAEPSAIGSSRGGGGTSSTTGAVDPATGMEMAPGAEPGTTGSSTTTGGAAGTGGTAGTSGTTGGGSNGGSDGGTGTTRPGSTTTDPPPTTGRSTTTSSTAPSTTTPPTSPSTTTPPATGGILDDLVGGLTGVLGSVAGALF